MSTVDERWKAFSDQPQLINVAVSRAKRHLIVVSSCNEFPAGSNISDLIGYIRYHNPDGVHQSKITSIFDYLYTKYTQEHLASLEGSDDHFEKSERLMYHLIQKVLADYPGLSCVMHIPLRDLLLRDIVLTEEEQRFAQHKYTHVDFLIQNKLTKQPVLVIEVDGFYYHNTPKQKKRDGLKNSILDKNRLPYLRCPTNGSGEKEKLTSKLSQIYSGKRSTSRV